MGPLAMGPLGLEVRCSIHLLPAQADLIHDFYGKAPSLRPPALEVTPDYFYCFPWPCSLQGVSVTILPGNESQEGSDRWNDALQHGCNRRWMTPWWIRQCFATCSHGWRSSSNRLLLVCARPSKRSMLGRT